MQDKLHLEKFLKYDLLNIAPIVAEDFYASRWPSGVQKI
jgi:hypothetical protein